jgi:hypothetical protein
VSLVGQPTLDFVVLLRVLVEVGQSSLLARRVVGAVCAAEVLDRAVIDGVLVARCTQTVHALLDVLVVIFPSVPVCFDALLRMVSLAEISDSRAAKSESENDATEY